MRTKPLTQLATPERRAGASDELGDPSQVAKRLPTVTLTGLCVGCTFAALGFALTRRAAHDDEGYFVYAKDPSRPTIQPWRHRWRD